MSRHMSDRLVLNDLNARSELEVIDGIYGMSSHIFWTSIELTIVLFIISLFGTEDRSIITTNSANILNIMAESLSVNPEEEVIRKRGRKKTPKISLLPLRRSPRKAPNPSSDPLFGDSQSSTTSDQTHDYFLRTPKKTPQKSSIVRTPSKQTPSKSGSMSVRRVSPRKRLQLDGNDSGIGLSPALSNSEGTPKTTTPEAKKQVPRAKTSSKSLSMTRRRRRRYF